MMDNHGDHNDITNLRKWRLVAGVTCVCLAIINWVVQSEVLQLIQTTYNKPFLLSFSTDAGYTLAIFFWLCMRCFNKFRHSSSSQLANLTSMSEDESILSVSDTPAQDEEFHDQRSRSTSRSTIRFAQSLIIPAFKTNIVCLTGTYLWYTSLKYTKASVNNTISQSTVAFVYIGSVLFFKTKCTIKKNIGVLFAIGGVALIAFDTNVDDSSDDDLMANLSKMEQLFGVVMAFVAAIILSMYELLVQYFSNK